MPVGRLEICGQAGVCGGLAPRAPGRPAELPPYWARARPQDVRVEQGLFGVARPHPPALTIRTLAGRCASVRRPAGGKRLSFLCTLNN